MSFSRLLSNSESLLPVNPLCYNFFCYYIDVDNARVCVFKVGSRKKIVWLCASLFK
jgi:hypothetical protein